MRRCLFVVLLVALATTVACTRKSLDVSATPTTMADLDAAGVLDASSRSIALIETPLGSGSGVLIEGGFVVTNAHVVDPFGEADITFEGAPTFEDVALVGADLEADIALLGPVAHDATPLELSPDPAPPKGAPVYLVGYPGGADPEDPEATIPADVEVTISGGLVSRERVDETFDQLYIQTDASIGYGQSGGALIDETGRIVGISGLAYEDAFALALSADDVRQAVGRIQRGDATGYPVFPTQYDTTSGSIDLSTTGWVGTLGFATTSDETVRLTVDDPEAPVVVTSLDGTIYLGNEPYAGIDPEGAGGPEGVELFPEEQLEVVDGAYQFDVPAESYVVVQIQASALGPDSVAFEVDRPVSVVRDTDVLQFIQVGQSVEGVVSPVELADVITFGLTPGQTVTITVDGAAGADVYFSVVAPGQGPDDLEVVDDDTRGLLGLGEAFEYTAEVDGIHEIWVSTNDYAATFFRVEVT